jgi:hypothetical protein
MDFKLIGFAQKVLFPGNAERSHSHRGFSPGDHRRI